MTDNQASMLKKGSNVWACHKKRWLRAHVVQDPDVTATMIVHVSFEEELPYGAPARAKHANQLEARDPSKSGTDRPTRDSED
jgi:hypothetical protein